MNPTIAQATVITLSGSGTIGTPSFQFLNPTGSANVETNNNTTYAFTVQTPTPLTVDIATCATGVTSGVVTVGFSGQGAIGTATITWSGCGAYTITDN